MEELSRMTKDDIDGSNSGKCECLLKLILSNHNLCNRNGHISVWSKVRVPLTDRESLAATSSAVHGLNLSGQHYASSDMYFPMTNILIWTHFIGGTVAVCALYSLHENRPRLSDVHGEEEVISATKGEHVSRLWTWIVMQDKIYIRRPFTSVKLQGFRLSECSVMRLPVCMCGHSLCCVYNLCVHMCLFVIVCVPICRGIYVLECCSFTKTDVSHSFFGVFFPLSLSPSLFITLCQQLPWKLFCSSSLHSWCVWLVSVPPCHKTQHTHLSKTRRYGHKLSIGGQCTKAVHDVTWKGTQWCVLIAKHQLLLCVWVFTDLLTSTVCVRSVYSVSLNVRQANTCSHSHTLQIDDVVLCCKLFFWWHLKLVWGKT